MYLEVERRDSWTRRSDVTWEVNGCIVRGYQLCQLVVQGIHQYVSSYMLYKFLIMGGWPSGLRRYVKAVVYSVCVGSNPTSLTIVDCATSSDG